MPRYCSTKPGFFDSGRRQWQNHCSMTNRPPRAKQNATKAPPQPRREPLLLPVTGGKKPTQPRRSMRRPGAPKPQS
jgi:hypothetical protein